MKNLKRYMGLSIAAIGVIFIGAAAADTGKVVISSYGGSFQDAQKKAFFEPYAKATGSRVTDTTGTGHAKVKAMVASRNITWDVISADAAAYENEVKDDLLEPIDYSVVKSDGIPADLRKQYGVGYMKFAQNMAWNKTKFPNGLTAAQFFDPKVKARRVMLALPYYNLEFALLADGVKPADLYPLDVDRGLKVIDRIKDQVVGFKPPSDLQALIQQGEVDLAFGPGGRIDNAIKAGAGWAYGYEASVTVVEYWAVIKGAPNKAEAMKFINFAAQPQAQAELPRHIFYGPTNVDALKLVDPAVTKGLPGNPENEKLGGVLNSKWWNENLEAVSARWNTYIMH
ncbi:extracellular solute-binding protein [Bosea caraganae]|uniref:Extracellular solute-binding protein n=1 Tax=Bosea caraganae TaxID=2763117 RepID=A0A370KY67_9HYPH|nr:polyamine ABC transporter substrate-binding protein [Bosea caraganae]RDJ19896.1 extracellular solute-binding protein [Bosea caraganae]RDJ23834.1 extracellular solute-binding protein [Bosea caraganae]